jgi:phenylacetate-CoA ligase
MTKQALPLLRYRTGDIASLRRGTCQCGRTLVKMSKVIGRKDDMLVVRGVNVYPSEIERVLLEEGALAPDYLLVVDQRSAQHQLIAICEPGTGPSALELDTRLIESKLKAALGLSVAVRLMPPGSVPRTEVGKAVRVVRWPGGEPPVPGLA